MTTSTGHELYQDGDSDVPSQLKDRNGDVVLAMCRLCGKAEIELEEPCPEVRGVPLPAPTFDHQTASNLQLIPKIRIIKELTSDLSPVQQAAALARVAAEVAIAAGTDQDKFLFAMGYAYQLVAAEPPGGG